MDNNISINVIIELVCSSWRPVAVFSYVRSEENLSKAAEEFFKEIPLSKTGSHAG